jgi:hypothetical protein
MCLLLHVLAYESVGASDRTGIGTPRDSKNPTTMSWQVMSIFRRDSIDLCDSKVICLNPGTILVFFPAPGVWLTLLALPTSATRCKIKVDVFSHDEKQLQKQDVDALKAYVEGTVRTLEVLHHELERSQVDPHAVSELQTHLKMERLAGQEIFPTQGQVIMSDAFCRAEKCKCCLTSLGSLFLTTR